MENAELIKSIGEIKNTLKKHQHERAPQKSSLDFVHFLEDDLSCDLLEYFQQNIGSEILVSGYKIHGFAGISEGGPRYYFSYGRIAEGLQLKRLGRTIIIPVDNYTSGQIVASGGCVKRSKKSNLQLVNLALSERIFLGDTVEKEFRRIGAYSIYQRIGAV